jgi:hypothetical protein
MDNSSQNTADTLSWDDRFESALAIFTDDSLAPGEFLEVSRPKTYLEPEKKLMLAMLNDAIYCYQHYFYAHRRNRKKLFTNAEQWILETGADRLYSFASVCEHLGIDPAFLRAGLQRWKERRTAELAQAKVQHWRPLTPSRLAAVGE